MSTGVKILPVPGAVLQSRALDYVELLKPELTSLSVLTALCGFYLAMRGSFDAVRFLHTAMGTALVGCGVGTLNQYLERGYDALMKRTERRPLPAGRVRSSDVLIFGIVISLVGITELTFFVNLLTGVLAILTFTTYLFVYTPLKRVTPYATLIGGIPGALPPMMGWVAVRDTITIETWILFGILFCWQMPHFLSLAWMYRKDYARAGFQMLSVVDEHGRRTSRHIIVFCLALIPASLMMSAVGLTGQLYFVGASLLGILFLGFGLRFARHAGRDTIADAVKANLCARRIFLVSLFYLPALMLLMMIDKV